MTRIVFFGSASYSLIILDKLISLSDFSLALVVTKIDRPVGRQQQITPNPVAQYALDHHLPLLQIEDFSPDVVSQISTLSADLGICVAFGPPFFDNTLINLFPRGIINLHPSPLPRYRGASPGPWQIINGETTSAITFFQIDLLPDHGPIITSLPFIIDEEETSASFYHKAFTLAAENLNNTLHQYLSGQIKLIPQNESQKTYFPKLSKNSGKINWTASPVAISRFVRAMQPWPIAWTEVKNHQGQTLRLKIFSFDTQPIQVQLEGKKPTLWSEIKNYYTIIKP